MHTSGEGADRALENCGAEASTSGDQQIIIEPLGEKHRLAEFVCCQKAKSPRVQNFLFKHALSYGRKNFARTFVAVHGDDEGKILGFYTLSAALISHERISRSQQKTGPGHIDFPMVKLGYMGADVTAAGMNLGSLLVVNAAVRVAAVEAIGIWGLVLDAEVGPDVDPEKDGLVTWYKKMHFEAAGDQLTDAGTYTMYARLSWLIPQA